MKTCANSQTWGTWNFLSLASKDNGRHTDDKLQLRLVSSDSVRQRNEVSSSSRKTYETLQITHQDNITTIIMNRPQRKNAFSFEMYNEVILALDEAERDDSILTVLTGLGDYFSSGNDLKNAMNNFGGRTEDMIRDSVDLIRKFVRKFIDFPKPLVAVVNGPAIGIGVTILGLFDLVYATDRATFNTPFSKLGQCPEACSSYTFPKMMGSAKATEVLLFNKTLTAHEAYDRRLVTEVFPDSIFQREVWSKLKVYANLPRNSLAFSKQLIRNVEKEKLYAACDKECELLIERASSDEALNAIFQFFQQKAKL
ncbi:enoyl-CoA delta isomerase 2-like [Rhinophrynus dorsalis]